MAGKNAFYAQSAGVTAVINASACGVLQTARQHSDSQAQLASCGTQAMNKKKRSTWAHSDRVSVTLATLKARR